MSIRPKFATVGILSIGDMGLGIAKLLVAHKFLVVTSVEGRSNYTVRRAQENHITTLSSDVDLVGASDYILSIVPPKDAFDTAQRISKALLLSTIAHRRPLYYLDLNAISPSSARKISTLFNPKTCHFIDGAIIGGPPSLRSSPAPTDIKNVAKFSEDGHAWNRPSIPISGPVKLNDDPNDEFGAELINVLNVKDIGNEVGKASGLKCCFATLTKGYTALAIQAFTSAERMGVLDELKGQMEDKIPAMLTTATSGVTAMPPKAYRWIREMEEIADCHTEDGGFVNSRIFDNVARIYKDVAEDEVLGAEKTGERKRGRTVEDVATCMGEALQKRRKEV